MYVPYDTTIKDEIRRLLQSVAYALRATVNTITKYSAGQIIFGRDMIIHQVALIDWNLIRERKRAQQIKDNNNENRNRSNYKWKIGDKCLIITNKNERNGKLLDYQHSGPYEIIQVNSNGTVKIKCGNFKETINIRRIDPYYDRTMHIGNKHSPGERVP